MPIWSALSKRQQQYLRAIYETYLALAYDRQHDWRRFGKPQDSYNWRWMKYGVFGGVGSPLYSRLSQCNLIDRRTRSTFNALESRGFITCMETRPRRRGKRSGKKPDAKPFLMIRLTEAGQRFARAATGIKSYQPGPPGTLREEHWEAMGVAWQGRPAGVQEVNGYYGDLMWGLWRRLKIFKAGALVEEYQTQDNRWIRLTLFGEQFYRENWQYYYELYPDIDAPEPSPEP